MTGGKEAKHEAPKHKSRPGPQLSVPKGGAFRIFLFLKKFLFKFNLVHIVYYSFQRFLSFVSVFKFFSLSLVFSSLL